VNRFNWLPSYFTPLGIGRIVVYPKRQFILCVRICYVC
jgi:hypothetical protein